MLKVLLTLLPKPTYTPFNIQYDSFHKNTPLHNQVTYTKGKITMGRNTLLHKPPWHIDSCTNQLIISSVRRTSIWTRLAQRHRLEGLILITYLCRYTDSALKRLYGATVSLVVVVVVAKWPTSLSFQSAILAHVAQKSRQCVYRLGHAHAF